MRKLDLDAARAARDAARAEAEAEPAEVVFAGETFELPAELPYAVIEAWMANDPRAGIRELFGGEAGDRFLSLRPSKDDIEAFLSGIMDLYGADPGESSASVSSLPNGSSRPRPISNANTA